MRFSISFVFLSQLLFGQKPHQSAEIIIQAFEEKLETKVHLTPHLFNIARGGHLLDEEKKERLKDLGFDFNHMLVNRGGTQRAEGRGLDQYYDTGYFRIHFTTIGRNAVNRMDQNVNNIPDYIESVAKIFDIVSSRFHDQMGFVLPPSDGNYSSDYDNGGSEHYDIYVRQLASNFYGYVQFEQYASGNGDNETTSQIKEKNAITSYMTMRNSYNNFNQLSEIENIQTTIAHEFFHSVQLGYDGWEKQWLLEATAVWMEEEMFDDINDVHQYMTDWFRYPYRSLDEEGSRAYGSYIFFEYIDQHMGGNNTIKNLFELSVDNDSRKKDGSHLAIDQALNQKGYSFKEALNSMSIANQIMSSKASDEPYTYKEADFYPINGPSIYKTVNFIQGRSDFLESSSLRRFGSQYIKITTSDPVLVDIENQNGPASDLQLNAILKRKDDSYLVISNSSVNIDPTELQSIHLSVVSQDTVGGDWNYRITFKDGRRGTDANLPITFTLTNPYPNPFNDKISFDVLVLRDAEVAISVYDAMGRNIKQIHKGNLKSGRHKFSWSAKENSGRVTGSGIYFIKVNDKKFELWRSVTLVK